MDDMTDFDPDDDRRHWSEVLVFPHPARLDDIAMDYYFRSYDGKWSEQTKRAMKELGADADRNLLNPTSRESK